MTRAAPQKSLCEAKAEISSINKEEDTRYEVMTRRIEGFQILDTQHVLR